MAQNQGNFLTLNESRNGENWVAIIQPEVIQRNTKRIVKEIAKAQIDYEKVGKYFIDLKFLENLIIGISNELEINTLNYNSCRFFYQYYPTTPNLASHINHLERVGYIYYTILERLNNVKLTGNIGYLVDVAGLLFNDRKHVENL